MRTNLGSERGQVMPIMALLTLVLIGIMGLAVDLGRAYTVKAQLSKSLDAAALAAVVELPNTTTASSKAIQYMNLNMPTASSVSASPDVSGNTVSVTASAHVNTIFLRVLGINSVDVSASAQAGASNLGTLVKLDSVLVLDDTGSIGGGCSSAQRTTPGQPDSYYAGCPLGLERNAAKTFLDTLFPASVPATDTQVAMVPFRGCYNATPYTNKYGQPNLNPKDEGNSPSWNAVRGCIAKSAISDLSNNPAAASGLKTKIDALRGAGGYPGTNLCLALSEGWRHLSDPTYAQTGARRVLVILSDGDNAYWDNSEYHVAAGNAFTSAGPGWSTGSRFLDNAAPKNFPTSPTSSNGLTSIGMGPNDCWPSGTISNTSVPSAQYDGRINQLDTQELAWADWLKASPQSVEIYVVGLGVSAPPDTPAQTCDASMRTTVLAGGSDRRNTSTDTHDRFINKCIASSKAGTNDHYFETTAAGLISVFQHIATQISYRLTK